METFDWTEFLESNNSSQVPEELFYHVSYIHKNSGVCVAKEY